MTGIAFVDVTLAWKRIEDRWHKVRWLWVAHHRDDIGGTYTLLPRTTEYRLWDPSTNTTTEVVKRCWITEYVPGSRDWDAIPSSRDLYCGNDLRAARKAAEKHHAETRRRSAWERYMRNNDPPAPTTPEEEARWYSRVMAVRSTPG
ncbi:Uncharacterised protein [Mycobacteroides abscessus subsp. abscessus]|uniref:hypothetical protein n=1 Tax=Mycobacteroides abscessus TaxID=36809 RepID=UPI00092B3CEB|nr:hypothetical protein [Mycobacteroides abscessus]SID32030.1 Uncharacterised protein [Mycobacteroides abscessus subsp. abscessus]SID68335.1 Uncharacterised protein [Mycobacteroides abscessus subsp. abscessus]SKG39145.1 Uncharacterised protein [Mycobacteroides abscessus subsp. abscessus]SKQ80053.1 Uncharacterised protein [Mycobacteroides abscessus subsp. abscessus]